MVKRMSVWSFFFRKAIDITHAIHEALPGVKVVWGGCHATLMPEACIEHCDGLVIGEGEKPMLGMAQGISTEAWFSVPGAWMRRESNVIRNPCGELNNLDDLPPPDLSDDGKCLVDRGELVPGDPWAPSIRHGAYTFMASRGCPFGCTYCGNHALARAMGRPAAEYLRWRSVDRVIAELRMVRDRFDVRRFVSLDEVFFLDRAWVREFAGRYASEIGLPLHCQVHPSQVDDGVTALFRKMDVRTVSIGVESGSEKTRIEVYNRRTPDAMLLEKAEMLHRSGVLVSYDFIFGNPLEGPDEVRRTLELLFAFPRPFRLNLYRLQLLPGTGLTGRLLKEGMAKPEDVQGASGWKPGRFDLASYGETDSNAMNRYLINLVFMLATTMVVWRGSRWRAFSPVPTWLVRFLYRHPLLFLNRFGRLIRKHRAFWAWLGNMPGVRMQKRTAD